MVTLRLYIKKTTFHSYQIILKERKDYCPTLFPTISQEKFINQMNYF